MTRCFRSMSSKWGAVILILLVFSISTMIAWDQGLVAWRIKPAQTRTILMSTMRSGSTFTGDLLQLSPDVMYFYEPLHYTFDKSSRRRDSTARDRAEGKFIGLDYIPETQDFSQFTMNCNLSDLNMHLMKFTFKSRSFDGYHRCLESGSAKEECRRDVAARCQNSPHVVSKILRFFMWEIDEMLARDPELKVIHLVRDPRGMFVSRIDAKFGAPVKALCGRINNDALLSLDLVKKYPGRLRTVRYEDLAMNPVSVTRQLYAFIGIEWTQEVEQKVRALTLPKHTKFKEQKHGTRRKNSTATAISWRNKIEFPLVTKVQEDCTTMMALYGFVKLESAQDVTNLTLPCFRREYSNAFDKIR